MKCSRCGTIGGNAECFVCTEIEPDDMTTTPTKPNRVRYFTDGKFYWKANSDGVFVRAKNRAIWARSCAKNAEQLLQYSNLTETTLPKGEIP